MLSPWCLAQESTIDADSEISLQQALTQGTVDLALRYRFETVDDDAFDDRAHASTLRTALGYATAPWRHTSVYLQAENVSALPDDDGYRNAGFGSLSNRVTDRPVVADPAQTDISQVYVQHRRDNWQIKLGRQVINLSDQRFVGAVGWRQHFQTFDAARIERDLAFGSGPKGGFEGSVDYVYLNKVHRIFGDTRDLSGHLLTVPLHGFGASGIKVTPFAYWLDFDHAPSLSTTTWGAELGGRGQAPAIGWAWLAKYAVQRDAGDNPRDIDTAYAYGKFELKWPDIAASVAMERLDGGSGGAFQTPLATLHKWNGWADKFLTTPSAGLDTLYVSVGGKRHDLKWNLVWLDFTSETGDIDYGHEIDAQLLWKTPSGVKLGFKAAHYEADRWSVDTDKFMVWASYAFNNTFSRGDADD